MMFIVSKNVKFGTCTNYEHTKELCIKYCLSDSSCKAFRQRDDVRLCMTDKFNKVKADV
jgi:hypothetical protein